ncbi:DUF6789 family protein [Halalkalicoccus tibetensis]|uniref:DUF6789 family protein n=1 Tax=Halalkalicoccus tibetensis TaxID=175632 RepID=A0ABD5UYE7_9EURY
MDDTISAIGAGTAGTIVIVLVLGLTEMTVGFGLHVFETLSTLFGSESPVPGLILFFAGGTLMWPMLYISLGQFLPGTGPTRGMALAAILWVGFAPGFAGGVTGALAPAFIEDGMGLVIYLIVTLIAHLVYGAILGGGYRKLGGSELSSSAAV